MEKNANLHMDIGGGAPCSAKTREMADDKAPSCLKSGGESCKTITAAAPLSTLGCTSSTTTTDTASVDPSGYQKSDDSRENCGSLPAGSSPVQSSLGEGSTEQLSNGTGHSQCSGPNGGGDGEVSGTTTKLVNNKAGGPPSSAKSTAAIGIADVQECASPGQQKLSPPTMLYTDKISLSSIGLVSSEHLSEDPSGSDPSPAGESRSIDSLESFSNLHSCPSSDLTSEGAEDRVLASALQSDELGAGGAQLAVPVKDRGAGQSVYHIKWIKWKEESTPIITQNENGPCPLLAIMNVLLLAWKVKMPPMMEIITAEQLMEYLGDYILDAKPKEISEAQRLNYEQNMSDAMAVLHKLQTGLDVNVRFTGVRVFEYTPECIVFDLLDIPLYHGWLVDPQMSDIVKAVGNCSYNQLVEKIISCKQSDNSELAGEGFVAEQFLHNTATQLTYHGLCELTSTVQEGELCVFFRNNHFSTMTKYKGQLYLLVTDQGFLTEEKVVWESLHNVDGDGNFCDSEFHLRPPSDPETVYRGQQDQIDQDYLMALSLQQEQQSQDLNWEQIPEGISDLELAKKLQEEEDRRASQFYQEQEQAQAAAAQGQGAQQPQGAAAAAGAAPSAGKPSGGSERKQKKELKEKEKEKDRCVLL
ncbi:ubiquitin carboxyl-terminal hydrolase MINDY-2 isoform X2 [Amia ocellicauda]|uniref:ubiquitin carboxyl-terminal hydrolase MINDY-2 isoform X2 n=1 Tax=Amia ocellicauda TaxID=2972642 RepID=UPI0034645620